MRFESLMIGNIMVRRSWYVAVVIPPRRAWASSYTLTLYTVYSISQTRLGFRPAAKDAKHGFIVPAAKEAHREDARVLPCI